MTRGGLTIDQKMVDRFVDENIKTAADFGKAINTESLGFDLVVDFAKAKEFYSRGLCLDLQRRERGSETIKTSDIAAALKVDNPLEYLKSKGYSERIIAKLAR